MSKKKESSHRLYDDDFSQKWLMEKLGIEVKKAMMAKKVTRMALADKMEWTPERIDSLIEGQMEDIDLNDVVRILFFLGSSLEMKLMRK
jgi:hypothetical protein